MSQNFDVPSIFKAIIDRFLTNLSLTWTQILQWDNRKRGVSPTFLFFSPSFILVCFTIISHCSTSYSQQNFSLVIFSVLALHAFLKLTHNPISTRLHYQFLYSCVLALLVLYYSPALPQNEVRILLAVLFPIYYHTLTCSISMTLFISFPVFLFVLCSSFYDSFQNTTIPAALIVIPTIFWTKAREIEHNISNTTNNKTPNLLKLEKRNDALEIKDDKLYLPELSEKETTSEKEPSPTPIVVKTVSETANEENEKVILGISHDCRNLLNSLKVILTVMKDDICHTNSANYSKEENLSAQDDHLQSAIAITEHLALLLTNLLDYLKGKNQDANTQEEMKLTTTLEKIWLMISPNLKRKFLGGSITIKNGTPLVLNLDERKFMGVLLNIIGNAMKFTDTGHIKINVNWKENSIDSQDSSSGEYDARANFPTPGVVLKKPGVSPSGVSDAGTGRQETLMSDQTNAVFSKTTFFDLRDIDSISFSKKCFTVMTEASHTSDRITNGVLVVTVRDTGCGIEEESLKKLFKKYGQVGEDQEKSKLGLGLGLWYTKYLLGKLNGKIDFRSTKNVGTWVKIEIPCKIAHQRREVKQMINPAIPVPEKKAGSSNKMYVFVRENDNLASLLVGEYLKKRLGKAVEVHEIKSVYDILASEKFRSGTPVLVVGKNSITRQESQGLRTLNRMQNEGEKVPVILIRESDDVIESVDQAWDDVDVQFTVKKPVKQVQLDEIVRYVNKSFEKVFAREAATVQKDEVPHVLIVDDENTSVMFLQKYLKKCGFSCLVARDGYEAVQIYQTRWPDIRLVLMDSEMPRMNGLDATKAIRRMGKDEELKIIGLTGDDSESFKRRAREIGMNDVIVKPVPAEKLLQIVNNSLELKVQ